MTSACLETLTGAIATVALLLLSCGGRTDFSEVSGGFAGASAIESDATDAVDVAAPDEQGPEAHDEQGWRDPSNDDAPGGPAYGLSRRTGVEGAAKPGQHASGIEQDEAEHGHGHGHGHGHKRRRGSGKGRGPAP